MKVAGALLAAALLLCAGCASDGGAIGGAQYAPEYDYNEFRAAWTAGNSRSFLPAIRFPRCQPRRQHVALLSVMQANKPRINFTFTLRKSPPRSRIRDYQLYLVFNAANDLGSNRVCEGLSRFESGRRRPGRVSTRLVVAAIDAEHIETAGGCRA